MIATAFLALLAQGPVAHDLGLQREAAHTRYAACLFRENDRRREAGESDLTDFGQRCAAERQEIIRLARAAERSPEVIAAGVKGFEDTFRESLARFNKLYPVKKRSNAQD